MFFESLLPSFCISLILIIPLGIKFEIDIKILIPSTFSIGVISGFILYIISSISQLRYYQFLIIDIFLVITIT